MIIVFLLLIISMVVAAGVWVHIQSQQTAKSQPPPRPHVPSIRDLHGECVDNPLNCEVDVVKTTIETSNEPEFNIKEFGFRINENLKGVKEKAAKISLEALTESMQNCKNRLPSERLQRKTYDAVGDILSREPATNMAHRTALIDILAEPQLDELIAGLESKGRSRADILESYLKFLDNYGPNPTGGVSKSGGATKCDFYVKPCAEGSEVCHPDAVRKYKYYKRPPIMTEEEIARDLKESGLTKTEDGLIVTLKSQGIRTDLSDEEIDEWEKSYDESAEAFKSFGQAKDFWERDPWDLKLPFYEAESVNECKPGYVFPKAWMNIKKGCYRKTRTDGKKCDTPTHIYIDGDSTSSCYPPEWFD